jgi:ABC-2 type transport system ATP-binding protein
MIQVERLCKRFGSVDAVARLSFQVGKGEIVGLLGPNGAGKTTTMRILTSYLAPTSGRAVLAGHDVLADPLGVRRSIGYLPENVPLYPEMRVLEYLRFRCRLKDVPRSRRRVAVAEAVERCGLGDVEDRILGHLSRGYRQRVGLAEALLHRPEILILDEPTSGLDPLQILGVRSLIRELGEQHTILVSTHIMPEVEAVCRRVIILARGRIVVDEPLGSLRREPVVLVEARGPVDSIRNVLLSIDGVRTVTAQTAERGLASFLVASRGDIDLREPICRRLTQNGWMLRTLELRRSSLEERFVEAVTGSATAGPEVEGH